MNVFNWFVSGTFVYATIGGITTYICTWIAQKAGSKNNNNNYPTPYTDCTECRAKENSEYKKRKGGNKNKEIAQRKFSSIALSFCRFALLSCMCVCVLYFRFTFWTGKNNSKTEKKENNNNKKKCEMWEAQEQQQPAAQSVLLCAANNRCRRWR